jgi:hypothetical protein
MPILYDLVQGCNIPLHAAHACKEWVEVGASEIKGGSDTTFTKDVEDCIC